MEGKIRNCIPGHQELGLPLDRLRRHYVDGLNEDPQTQACEGMTLEDMFQKARSTPSDINEHCDKLRELASQSDTVIEFGMRHGATDFSFVQGDSLSVHIDPCDLLFIDTRHTADQSTNEFQRNADKVRRWIVLHDTQIFGELGEDGGPGLLPAVRRILNENPEWSVVHHTQANHVLTVLSRDPRDKPALPGTIRMVANFTKSLAAHVADGLQKVDAPELQHCLEICTLCDQRSNDRCSVCGCYLAEKASRRSSECPLGKWKQREEVPDVE